MLLINQQVVKLFNVIQQSQAAASAAAAESKASRGSGKPSLPAPTTDNKILGGKGKGRGKKGHVAERVKECKCMSYFFFPPVA
jgi:hypothetical protein